MTWMSCSATASAFSYSTRGWSSQTASPRKCSATQTSAGRCWAMSDVLVLEGVRVAIQGADVLRGVSLKIPHRGVVALVGRNGAGKTTTLRTVMGLLPLQGGRVVLDGADLAQIPPFKRAQFGIGYVP